MANQVQETISREADDIEQRKVGLMDSAKAQVDAANLSALQGEYLTPDYQVAGMSPDQLNALEMGRQGIGAYQPFLTAGARDVTAGSGMLSEAADVLRGADTRGQFAGAQAAMNQAAIPIGQMTGSANLVTQGVPLIGQGAQGITAAQQMANQYAQANMGQSLGTLQQGIGALQGAAQMYDPSNAQKFMNPYQQQVIDESIRQINRQGDISRQNLQAQATRAGAFGGSREGVQRAELERAISEQRNAAIVGGLSQGYSQASGQAQQAFEQQQGRQLAQAQGFQGIGGLYGQQALQQAQLGQGAAGLQGNLSGQLAGLAGQYGNLGSQQANIYGQQSQLGQSMAQGIGNLANQQFGIGQGMAQGLGALGTQKANVGMQNAALGQQAQAQSQQDTNFLYNLGSSQQKQAQSELDASRQNTLQQNMQPYQQMAFLSDIYRGAPSSQMSSMQQSQAAPSPFQQAAGLGIAGLSAVAAGSRAGILGP
jgi:hypothetical protein